jgi:hypothetical protein
VKSWNPFNKKNLFGPQTKSLKIIDIQASDLESYKDGIDEITNREVDCFIIRKVFSQEQVNLLVKNYEKVPAEEKSSFNTGMITYPAPFVIADQKAADSSDVLKEFHENAERFWSDFSAKFQVDFVAEILETLNKIGGGRITKAPKGFKDCGIYNPATFKHLIPGEGEFKAHCGNYFHKEFPSFYTHMGEISMIEDQMSYFVMLEPADSGGELTMYGVEWEEAEVRDKDNTTLRTKKGKAIDLLDTKNVFRTQLNPEPGDMIVFAGGRIWHRVEVASGKKPRYTIGGFLTRSKNDKELFVWS